MEDGGGEKLNPSPNGGEEPRQGLGGEEPRQGAKQKEGEKEGRLLLGSPTFADLGSGRLRCVETGHELPSRERDSYARSKACRLALIDAALAQNKAPLNMFKPSPLSKSKLICKLTGDTINKSEEHIWKHINGRRFLNKLEQKEEEMLASPKKTERDMKQERKPSKESKIATKKAQKKQDADGNGSLAKEPAEHSSDPGEHNFWTPPVGSRWDFDNGRDRWESCTCSDGEEDDVNGLAVDDKDDKDNAESAELSMRTKRMSIDIGPSSFASRKKKIKKTQ